MKNENHKTPKTPKTHPIVFDKTYNDIELINTKVEIVLDAKSELDNIIYILICAKDKLENSEYGTIARLELAQGYLNEYIKKY